MNSTRKTLYNRWHHIMERCYNPSRKDYKYYGEKGVCVCIDWHSFKEFEKWFNQELENTALHLFVERSRIVVDRINPHGWYAPSNCQLITDSENSHKAIKGRDAKGRFVKA